MNDQYLIELAREYLTHFHAGQFRKGSNLPYHTHPIAVAEILAKYGYDDTVTQCIALLHDAVEDTKLIMVEIKERFGYEIANGVFILSKNTISKETVNWLKRVVPFEVDTLSNNQLYQLRLSFARKKIKRIKIADMIHNTQDLISLSKPESIAKKLDDANRFYIPIGKEIAPLMVKELEDNLKNYEKKSSLGKCQHQVN